MNLKEKLNNRIMATITRLDHLENDLELSDLSVEDTSAVYHMVRSLKSELRNLIKKLGR